nr:immunoglobulin heavy chain junction region [Mus musculus]
CARFLYYNGGDAMDFW